MLPTPEDCGDGGGPREPGLPAGEGAPQSEELTDCSHDTADQS